jgi:hypothetical protein
MQIKSCTIVKKLVFALMITGMVHAAIKPVPTSSAINNAPLNAGMSDADAQKLPYYWMRLINIQAKALEICDLVGNDRVLFVNDLNLVMKSPINNRSSLERIRFSRVLANAMRHKAFVGSPQAQTQLGSMNAYVQKTITLDDYFAAINILLASTAISEKRSTEVLSYMWLVATTPSLTDDQKSNLIDIITNTAMPKMPAYQPDLQRILDLLNQQPVAPQPVAPQIITQTQVIHDVVQAPAPAGRVVFLTGHSGTASRRNASVLDTESTAADRIAAERQHAADMRAQTAANRAANQAKQQAAPAQAQSQALPQAQQQVASAQVTDTSTDTSADASAYQDTSGQDTSGDTSTDMSGQDTSGDGSADTSSDGSGQ